MSIRFPSSFRPDLRPLLIPDMPRAEIVISFVYLILGCAWIVFSDSMLDVMSNENVDTAPLQTIKGLNFILTTAVIFYFILRHLYRSRRKAETEARAITERFELVARVSTDAIFDWNLTTDTVFWSEGLQNVFGHPVEYSGTSMEVWRRRVHPDDQERLSANLEAAREGGRSFATDEFRFQRKDGSYAEVAIRAQLLRDASGTVTRLVGGLRDITQRKQAQEELALSRHRLRALSAKLESLREEERSRISREIHDQLGQMLTGLKMDLRWIERRLGDLDGNAAINPILDKAVEAGGLADETISAVQKIASELRPGVLDNLGLAAAIRYEAARFQERTGIACDVRVPEQPMPLARDVATAAFRIFQEALTNVTRHATATQVAIELRLDDNDFVLEIIDNGRGISAETLTNPRSLGLLGMQERAANINGQLTIQRGESAGTRVILRAALDTHDTRIWEQL
jgi:two-component system sensor histidine kinase UhpB